MKIALVMENSQKKKNEFVWKVLEKVASKYHHEVFNYGVSEGKTCDIDYVGAGILTGILLNGEVVDFVITGCATGEGAMMSANAMPNVTCGLVEDAVDMELFLRVNGGNAISIPFGKNFGIGSEILLENIFETLFQTEKESGYPKERKEVQMVQRIKLKELKRCSQIEIEEILEEFDKDLLYNMVHNDYFEENFFKDCKKDSLGVILKQLIDAWE